MIRFIPPRRRHALGADLPSSCDSQTQYFDSEFTQTCRSFSDVGPPAAVKLGPSCAAYAAYMKRPPENYATRTESDCAKKLAVATGSGKKKAAPSSNWLLPVAIGGGILVLVMMVRH
jgi:hypothetical protein